MIQMLRQEACSGSIHDLAHVRTQLCLADPLTKSTTKPDNLILAVQTGKLCEIDMHPPFRLLVRHKAFYHEWCLKTLKNFTLYTDFLEDYLCEDAKNAQDC